MRDLSHIRGEREIWITRGHLYAIGVTTCCIGLLSFFVGLLVGRSERVKPEVSTETTTLVAPMDKVEALDELLARVEARSNTTTPDGVLTFPEALPSGDRKTGAMVESGYTPVPARVAPGRAEPTAPDSSTTYGSVPKSGWALEIAVMGTAEDADAKVNSLAQQNLPAYRIVSVVDGKNRYRVRIGGYPTREEAEGAVSTVRRYSGSQSPVVTEAP